MGAALLTALLVYALPGQCVPMAGGVFLLAAVQQPRDRRWAALLTHEAVGLVVVAVTVVGAGCTFS